MRPKRAPRENAGEAGPRVVVVIVDGLPLGLAEEVVPELPFLGPRLPHRATAVSCFPSTTGPAYFPFLAGCTPGRANVPGIRWFDRTRPTRSAFPHRGLRSYVGPDARRLASDTQATTLFARHAWIEQRFDRGGTHGSPAYPLLAQLSAQRWRAGPGQARPRDAEGDTVTLPLEPP